jgi:hypothetical protein
VTLRSLNTRFTFWGKLAAALALVALAEALFTPTAPPGAVAGVFALAWVIALGALNPGVRRDPRARLAATLAIALALLLVESPGGLALALFLVALCMAALLPRSGRFDDAWRWSGRLAFNAATGFVRPIRDAARLRRRAPASARVRLRALALAMILPLTGGAVFLTLFAAANPLISGALEDVRSPRLDLALLLRLVFWILVLLAVWSVLRPRLPRRAKPAPRTRPKTVFPSVNVTSSALSLIVFNAVFALQNGLDAAYLWGRAGLPEGMTLAEYAHRGAYPLIATALLAGLFVLVVLKPGSETARRPLIRWLVVLWIAQNLFLVASTALRTLDYVEAYSLTRMRIAALIWMGLVAVGLVLICWRLLRNKSGAWLINANALATLAVLAAVTIVDLGAVAAAWNVRHAEETGGRGPELDLCYLGSLGSSSLVSLAKLEAEPGTRELRERVGYVRARNQATLAQAQNDWRRWNRRDARRLTKARRLTPARAPASATAPRDCNGRLRPAPVLVTPPAPVPPAAASTVMTVPPVRD